MGGRLKASASQTDVKGFLLLLDDTQKNVSEQRYSALGE